MYVGTIFTGFVSHHSPSTVITVFQTHTPTFNGRSAEDLLSVLAGKRSRKSDPLPARNRL